ncbi:MAG: hypothetical protein ACLFRA_01710 [Alphaproteobacteria bacterium]
MANPANIIGDFLVYSAKGLDTRVIDPLLIDDLTRTLAHVPDDELPEAVARWKQKPEITRMLDENGGAARQLIESSGFAKLMEPGVLKSLTAFKGDFERLMVHFDPRASTTRVPFMIKKLADDIGVEADLLRGLEDSKIRALQQRDDMVNKLAEEFADGGTRSIEDTVRAQELVTHKYQERNGSVLTPEEGTGNARYTPDLDGSRSSADDSESGRAGGDTGGEADTAADAEPRPTPGGGGAGGRGAGRTAGDISDIEDILPEKNSAGRRFVDEFKEHKEARALRLMAPLYWPRNLLSKIKINPKNISFEGGFKVKFEGLVPYLWPAHKGIAKIRVADRVMRPMIKNVDEMVMKSGVARAFIDLKTDALEITEKLGKRNLTPDQAAEEFGKLFDTFAETNKDNLGKLRRGLLELREELRNLTIDGKPIDDKAKYSTGKTVPLDLDVKHMKLYANDLIDMVGEFSKPSADSRFAQDFIQNTRKVGNGIEFDNLEYALGHRLDRLGDQVVWRETGRYVDRTNAKEAYTVKNGRVYSPDEHDKLKKAEDAKKAGASSGADEASDASDAAKKTEKSTGENYPLGGAGDALNDLRLTEENASSQDLFDLEWRLSHFGYNEHTRWVAEKTPSSNPESILFTIIDYAKGIKRDADGKHSWGTQDHNSFPAALKDAASFKGGETSVQRSLRAITLAQGEKVEDLIPNRVTDILENYQKGADDYHKRMFENMIDMSNFWYDTPFKRGPRWLNQRILGGLARWDVIARSYADGQVSGIPYSRMHPVTATSGPGIDATGQFLFGQAKRLLAWSTGGYVDDSKRMHWNAFTHRNKGKFDKNQWKALSDADRGTEGQATIWTNIPKRVLSGGLGYQTKWPFKMYPVSIAAAGMAGAYAAGAAWEHRDDLAFWSEDGADIPRFGLNVVLDGVVGSSKIPLTIGGLYARGVWAGARLLDYGADVTAGLALNKMTGEEFQKDLATEGLFGVDALRMEQRGWDSLGLEHTNLPFNKAADAALGGYKFGEEYLQSPLPGAIDAITGTAGFVAGLPGATMDLFRRDEETPEETPAGGDAVLAATAMDGDSSTNPASTAVSGAGTTDEENDPARDGAQGSNGPAQSNGASDSGMTGTGDNGGHEMTAENGDAASGGGSGGSSGGSSGGNGSGAASSSNDGELAPWQILLDTQRQAFESQYGEALREYQTIKGAAGTIDGNNHGAAEFISDLRGMKGNAQELVEQLRAEGKTQEAERLSHLLSGTVNPNIAASEQAQAEIVAILQDQQVQELKAELRDLKQEVANISTPAEAATMPAKLAQIEEATDTLAQYRVEAVQILQGIEQNTVETANALEQDPYYAHSQSGRGQIHRGLSSAFGERSVAAQVFESEPGGTSTVGGLWEAALGVKNSVADWWGDTKAHAKTRGERNFYSALENGAGFLGVMMAMNTVNNLAFGGQMPAVVKWGVLLAAGVFFMKRTHATHKNMLAASEGRSPFVRQGRYGARAVGTNSDTQSHAPIAAADDYEGDGVLDRNGNQVPAGTFAHLRVVNGQVVMQGHEGNIPQRLENAIEHQVDQHVARTISAMSGRGANLPDELKGKIEVVVPGSAASGQAPQEITVDYRMDPDSIDAALAAARAA